MSVIGAIRVTMGIDTAAYESGLRRAENRTRQAQRTITSTFGSMRTAAAGIAAAIAGSMLATQARQAFEYAASLQEASRAIGLTVEQYQILNRAALENGFTMETAARGMGFFTRVLGQAQAGLPAAVRAFRQIGITPEQLRGFSSVEDALRAVMDRLRNLNSVQAQAAAGNALFSRSFRDMSPFLTQGAQGYDEVAEAARRAGLITEEQARRADEASDQLAILGHTLRTNLASALVDLIPFIQSVVSGLGQMASAAASAISLISSIRVPGTDGRLSIGRVVGAAALSMLPWAGGSGAAGSLLRQDERRGGLSILQGIGRPGGAQPQTLDLTPPPRGGGRGGGGGGRGEAERAARAEADFQDELRRHRLDRLREEERQATDIVAQTNLRRQIADVEREEYVARLDLRVRLNELSQARRGELLAAFDNAQEAQRAGFLLEERNRADDDRLALAETDYQQAAERLRLEADNATTAGERRAAELRLLELTLQHEIAKREAITEERHGFQAAEQARREIAGLRGRHAGERERVLRSTRGPLEEFLADLPTSAARANEALQNVAVNGLRSLEDGLVDAITGARSLADAFSDMARSIIADMVRIIVQQRILGPLAQAVSGGFGGGLTPKTAGGFSAATASGIKGLASGGSFPVGGMSGVDRNLLSINGIPAARVSANERINVTPARSAGAQGVVVNQYFSTDASGAATREDLMHLANAVKPMARQVYADLRRRA